MARRLVTSATVLADGKYWLACGSVGVDTHIHPEGPEQRIIVDKRTKKLLPGTVIIQSLETDTWELRPDLMTYTQADLGHATQKCVKAMLARRSVVTSDGTVRPMKHSGDNK